MRKRFTLRGAFIGLLALPLLMLTALQAHAEPLLNGLSPHLELGKERFIAGLYLDNLSNNANDILKSDEHKRISLHVTTKRLSHRSLKRMWIEGMAINTPGSELSKYAKDTVAFASLFKQSLTAGDVINIDRQANQNTSVFINGIKLGSFSTEGFFEVLLRTWIGNIPLSSSFRTQLLQAGEVDNALLSRYESISPGKDRIAAIKTWNQPIPKPTATPKAIKGPSPSIAAPSVKAPANVFAKITPPTVGKTGAGQASATSTLPLEPKPPALTLAKGSHAVDEDIDADDLGEEEGLDEEELTAESLVARQQYHSSLLRWTYKYINYPKRAIKRSQEGSVRVSVTIDRAGKIKEVQPIEESKYSLLNREALRAVESAEPFPVIPNIISGEDFQFSLPIVFRLPR